MNFPSIDELQARLENLPDPCGLSPEEIEDLKSRLDALPVAGPVGLWFLRWLPLLCEPSPAYLNIFDKIAWAEYEPVRRKRAAKKERERHDRLHLALREFFQSEDGKKLLQEHLTPPCDDDIDQTGGWR